MNRKIKSKLKRDIAELLLTRIESDTRSGHSPVTGNAYVKLSPDYSAAKKKAGKGTSADLHFNDELIEAVGARFKENAVVLKITDRDEKLKANNHNKKKGVDGGTSPRREFLPDDAKGGKFGTFSASIRSDVAKLINKAVKIGS